MTIETRALTLIRTKLQRPRLPGDLVRRPRLTEQMQRAHHRKLTLISAMAGTGKTPLSSGRLMAVFACLSILLLVGPLTAIHANGAPVALTGEQQTEPPPPLHPEQVRFGHITTEDGLSEGRVWGIDQDHRGFLWFTTYDGINRYDGHKFRVYKYDPQNSNSPSSTLYRRVLEDSKGTLWFGSLGQGLSRFDPETEQWTNFRHDPQDPDSLSGDAIWAIAEDQRGDLWIGTEANGLNRSDHETGQFTHYQPEPGA
jgi:hypothetical protein